jgi:predicted regulator of Ras-like GTPase activity (Roadblock/LC7/MglB family)
MSSEVTQSIDEILKNVPGVVGVLLTDIDGIPIYTNGRFDLQPFRLCALTTVACKCSGEVGNALGQPLTMMIAEYTLYKIFMIQIPELAQLIILAKVQDAQMGFIRIEANKAIQIFLNSLESKNLESPS